MPYSSGGITSKSVEILPGSVEPIVVDYYQPNGTLITGATVQWSVTRTSDGYQYNFGTNTFASSGGTTTAMSESPSGHYASSWNTALITNANPADSYIVIVYDVTNSRVVASFELRVRAVAMLAATLPAAVWATVISSYGTYAQIGTAAGVLYALKIIGLNKMVEVAGNPGSLTLYQDNGVTPYATMTLADPSGAAVVAAPGEPAQRGPAA